VEERLRILLVNAIGIYAEMHSDNYNTPEEFWKMYLSDLGTSAEELEWLNVDLSGLCHMPTSEPYYFTFGSYEKFPYQNSYLVVYGTDIDDAIRKFRGIHPDINPGTVNCSDWYRQEQWDKTISKHAWKDRKPAEIII